jgi:two-component system, NarL family, nitrate/nitrite response regulator NarL
MPVETSLERWAEHELGGSSPSYHPPSVSWAPADRPEPGPAQARAVSITSIRLAVIDDHPMMRDGIAYALGEEDDFDVVGDGASADDAIAIADAMQPDIMLLDINMPGGGLAALRHITVAWPKMACVVITAKEDAETVGDALRIGARGYVLKGMSGTDLARALRSIHQGELYITPSLAKALLTGAGPGGGAGRPAASGSGLDHLTKRETEILRRIAQGMINKQIGHDLGLTEKTVKHYVTNILQKLHVSNRVEAALIAQQELKPIE